MGKGSGGAAFGSQVPSLLRGSGLSGSGLSATPGPLGTESVRHVCVAWASEPCRVLSAGPAVGQARLAGFSAEEGGRCEGIGAGRVVPGLSGTPSWSSVLLASS